MKISKLFLLIIIFSIFYFLFFDISLAAVLYLEPSQGEYQPNDTFIVKVRIDTEDECINTAKVDLKFSQDILKAIDFSRGQSIITFWLKEPEINQQSGLISFSGGIPGGYCGIVPGDPGKSNSLGKIVFQVISSSVPYDSAQIVFQDDSQVLLNDGLGSQAELTAKGAVFSILSEKAGPPKDEWQAELKEDNIPPELFEIKVHQDPAIFEGKNFIIFFTIDKQTGVDRYEIKEGQKEWKIAKSPYLLENQQLTDVIKVKVVDKANNERIAEYIPKVSEKRIPYQIIYWIFIIIILVIISWIIFRIIRKKTDKIGGTKQI